MNARFSWDSRKAAANFTKHGVGFVEAMTAFADPLARIFDDPDHSEDEPREIIVGNSSQRRLLIVCFTEREEIVRLISAREATRREQNDYEESL